MPDLDAFTKTRRRFLDRHSDAADWRNRLYSAGTYSLYRVTQALLRAHCRGRVLDAGAGRGAWRRTIEGGAEQYESLDRSARGDHRPTHVGDVDDMPGPEGQYDTVVCAQVLEHVASPAEALAEMHRVLRPGGVLILTVPHLSRRHELPHDYFRYTQEGVQALLEASGFDVFDMTTYGGVLSFLHHQTSFVFPGLLTAIPGVTELGILLNAPLSWALAALDPLLDRRALLPLGIAVAARKTS